MDNCHRINIINHRQMAHSRLFYDFKAEQNQKQTTEQPNKKTSLIIAVD